MPLGWELYCVLQYTLLSENFLEVGKLPIFNLTMFQQGQVLPGPKSGLFSNTQMIVPGDARTDKAKAFIEKGCPD